MGSGEKELEPAAALGAWELRLGRVRVQEERQDGELGTQPFNAYAVQLVRLEDGDTSRC